MGLALAGGGARFAIGTTPQVWEFRDVPSVARRLEPPGRHDACFLSRSSAFVAVVAVPHRSLAEKCRLPVWRWPTPESQLPAAI
jgi:hypothetical protein